VALVLLVHNLQLQEEAAMAKFDRVMSTGKEHQQFESGSRRDSAEGKGRPDLLPVHALIRIAKVCDPHVIPIHGIIRLSVHYENGAVKYGDRNWELGQPISRYYQSSFRHLQKWVGGAREEDHLAAVIWNVCAIMDHEERIERDLLDPKWNDMPHDPATGLPITAFRSSDIQVAPWTPDMKIAEHAWVAFNHHLWWSGGDRTVDHLAIIARAGMSMVDVEERVERDLISAESLNMPILKIFVPGEFVEADRKRKEQEEAELTPVLLVENATGKPLGELLMPVTKRRGPGPDYAEDTKHHATDPTQNIKIAPMGSRVTETEA